MKALNNKSVLKLVNRFDNELRVILMNDLKAIKSTKEAIIKNLQQRDQLSIA
jgi:hypothetical protein